MMVLPALLERVGCSAVGFHHHAEIRVQGIAVSGSSPTDRAYLAFRSGQPVRPLHPPDVAQFEDGVGSVADVVQREREFRRQRTRPRLSMAARSRVAVVSWAPQARASQASASSRVGLHWVRSSVVSSIRVRGGNEPNCRASLDPARPVHDDAADRA